jgi:hypothetical protein
MFLREKWLQQRIATVTILLALATLGSMTKYRANPISVAGPKVYLLLAFLVRNDEDARNTQAANSKYEQNLGLNVTVVCTVGITSSGTSFIYLMVTHVISKILS